MAVPTTVRKAVPLSGAARAWIFLLIACALLPASSRASLIWVSDLGTDVTSSFGVNGLVPVTLSVNSTPWSLPFEGTSNGALTLSAAGFVYLGGVNTSQCCSTSTLGSALSAFESGPARVALAWYDLQSGITGHVYVNQLASAGTEEAVITFAAVPSDSSTSDPATMQLQLFSTGEIIFSYMLFDSNSLGSDGALIGLTSAGNFSPVSFDMASVIGRTSVTTSPTAETSVYDYIQPGGSVNFTGQSVIFTPQSNGGFSISSANSPEPATLLPSAAVFFLFCFILVRQKRLTE